MTQHTKCYVSQPHKGSVYVATRDPRFQFNLLWSTRPWEDAEPFTVCVIEWYRVPDTVRRAADKYFGIG